MKLNKATLMLKALIYDGDYLDIPDSFFIGWNASPREP